ncbi:MAG TPA: DNA oxidative demethylase AlkB [Terriglobia bacterium]|nr:DNA oxidative demethylase AlkB [Terriglobia bacterium]
MKLRVADGAALLQGFAAAQSDNLLSALESVTSSAPFRHMITPGGFRMSVAMTNCGRAGWVSDPSGYRYDPVDPDTGQNWPAMPPAFWDVATQAAAAAGFENFEPDVCLVNRYEPGARLSLHQDKDEQDFGAPIVSVSLGLPAVFLFGGLKRSLRPARIPVKDGDVVVWGGASRLVYHGVAPLKEGEHPATGRTRINLTFRKAL